MPEIRENSSITISALNSRWSLISLVTALYFTRFSSTAAWVRADLAAQLDDLGRGVAGRPRDQVEIGIAGGRLAGGIVEVPLLLLILEIAQQGLHLRDRLFAVALRARSSP